MSADAWAFLSKLPVQSRFESPTLRRIFQYSIAAATVLLCLFVREILQPELGPDAPLLVFLFAVIVSNWFGSTGSGLFATALSGFIGTYFFIQPTHSFFIHDTADQLRLALFLAEGVAFSLIMGAMKLAFIKERNTREHLERTLKELTEAQNKTEEAIRTKTLFLTNLTHELRTPLNAITGYADLLNSSELSQAERSQYMQALHRNSRFLAKLIDSFLDLSKVEAGQMEFEIVSVSLPDILSSMREMMAHAAKAKGLNFSIIEATPLPSLITTDPTRLRQVLINLIGNAIKFTKAGFVRMTVKSVSSRDRNHCRLAFIIEDSGPGLSDEQKLRLFKPFSQGDGSTFRSFGGTGLGLYLARRLARLLGGDVDLSFSEPGRGSRFEATFEVGLAARPGAEALSAKQRETIHFRDGIHALLVDDSPDNQIIVGHGLTGAGIEVDFASCGLEAIDKVQSMFFDFVIMDVQMPDLDGYETTEHLRSIGYNGPVIALTAHATDEARDRAFASGCSHYLTKPVDLHKLMRLVQGELSQGPPSRHLSSGEIELPRPETTI